jgi:hypothetical protein
MSHISGALTTSLTVTRGSKKPFRVNPLVIEPTLDVDAAKKAAEAAASQGSDALKAWWSSAGVATQKAIGGADALATLKVAAQNADAAQSTALDAPEPMDI